MTDIILEDIDITGVPRFWELHWEYLERDIFPCEDLTQPLDDEDKEYFRSAEYRGVIEKFMTREPDRTHLVCFIRDTVKIGCAQYVTYKSEDGKCLILDFWVFSEFRGDGTGHKCFEALRKTTTADGAKYYEINVSNKKARRFWMSIGFYDNGKDEYDMPMMKLT